MNCFSPSRENELRTLKRRMPGVIEGENFVIKYTRVWCILYFLSACCSLAAHSPVFIVDKNKRTQTRRHEAWPALQTKATTKFFTLETRKALETFKATTNNNRAWKGFFIRLLAQLTWRFFTASPNDFAFYFDCVNYLWKWRYNASDVARLLEWKVYVPNVKSLSWMVCFFLFLINVMTSVPELFLWLQRRIFPYKAAIKV